MKTLISWLLLALVAWYLCGKVSHLLDAYRAAVQARQVTCNY